MTVAAERLDDDIIELAIDDPEHKNALTDACIQQLIDALQRLRHEHGLKVLLVTGRPDVFCSGAPLERLRRAAAGEEALGGRKGYWPLLDEITTFPLPVVGALEGHAIGGGLMLALLLCDLLVAAETRRYGVSFSALGFTPGMGATAVIPELTGHVFAAEMLLGGKLFTGSELEHRGLFNYVVPAAEVRDVSLDLARRLAEKPRYVLAMIKETLASRRRRDLHETVMREAAMQEICLARAETAEAIESMYLR